MKSVFVLLVALRVFINIRRFYFESAGILFCFEPPFEQVEGKRARRYLVNCARRYRQMLDSLLHEVTVITFCGSYCKMCKGK